MTSEDLAARGAPELDEALADLRKAVEGGHPWHPGDFEAFTPKRAKTVATILNAVLDGSLLPAALAASPVDDILAQLADAKAAQALVLEQAAGHIVSEGERLAEGIPNAGPGLEFLRELADEVRALADTDGLALVQALRAEIARKDQTIEAWREDLTNERADRDRLAAANAALLEYYNAVEAFNDKPWKDDIIVMAKRVNVAKAAVTTAIAEVQADARREGGE
jgi:hypothetical protein